MTTNPNEIEAAVLRVIETYADSYTTMSKIGEGRVYCTSVAYDLRRNIADGIKEVFAASARGVVDGWQPIETMPSGKWVFVYVPGVSGSGVEAIKKPDVSGAFWAGRIISLQTGREITRATHWRAAIRPPEGSPLSDNSLYAAPSSPAATPEDTAVRALNGYRAAVSWIGADSWDGCSDCIDVLKAARTADIDWDWAGDPNRVAAELKHIEPFMRAHKGYHDRPAATPEVEREDQREAILEIIRDGTDDDGFLHNPFDVVRQIQELFRTPPAAAGEGNPDANDMAEADAEVERILAMSDEEVMEGVTPEEIAKMRRDIDRLSRTFAAGRRTGFIAGRDAAADCADNWGATSGKGVANAVACSINIAAAIRAIEPGERVAQ